MNKSDPPTAYARKIQKTKVNQIGLPKVMFSIKKNITARLVWFSVLAGLLIGILLTIIQLSQDFQQEQTSKEFAIQQLLSSLEDSAANAAFHVDAEKGYAVMSGLFVMPGVYRAEIRDDFGNILVQKRSAMEPDKPNLFARLLLGEEMTRTVTLTVQNHPTTLGHMRIWLDLNSMTENFGTRVWLVIVSGLVRNLLMSSILAIVFYFFLAKPLVAAATEVKSNKDRKIDEDGAITIPSEHEEDELGALLSSFNTMISERMRIRHNLSATLNSLAEAVIAIDNEGHIINLNIVAEKMAERTFEEARGSTLKNMFNITAIEQNRTSQTTQQDLLDLAKIDDFSIPFQLTTTNGQVYKIAVSKAPIQSNSGKAMGEVFVFRDITEDYALRKALVKSEFNYRSLFENAEISIWKQDLSEVHEALIEIINDGITDLRSHLTENPEVLQKVISKIRILEVNQAALKLFGADSFEHFLSNIMECIIDKSLPAFIEEFCALSKGRTNFLSEFTLQNLEGQEIIVIVTFQIPQIMNGYKNVSVSFVDITARKQMEVRLQEAKEEAEKANRAKTEFLSSMSHELRTPMNAVLGFAQMLQFDPHEELSSTQNEYVDNIRAGGEHLLELINGILDLVRIESDQSPVYIEDVDATELMDECVNLAVSLGKSRNISIVNNFTDDVSTMIRTDAMRFKQVLLNLLSNAVKYNKDNGLVTIEVMNTDDHFLQISVKDTGIGIAEKDHDEVFQLFHRLDSDPTVAREGTGIGLTVTKLLVDRLSGRIGYESNLGEGSIFWVEFPLATNQKALIWTDAMRVGIDAIDKDHQFLVRLLNTFVYLSIDDENVDTIINEMLDYTQYHFAREETIMEVCDYPHQMEHRRQHREFIKHINRLTDTWHLDRSEQTLQDYKDLTNNWWFAHIVKMDSGLSYSISGKEKEIREALERLELKSRPKVILASN